LNQKKETLLYEEIADRWQQYTEELHYGSEELEELEKEEEITPEELGPTITKAEFEKALNELKLNKAYGVDNIPAVTAST